MSDLQKRLDSLFRQGLIRKGMKEEEKNPQRDKLPPLSLSSNFEGKEVGDEREKCLLFRHHCPNDLVYGLEIPVGELLNEVTSFREVNIVRGDQLASREELLFLDIETTGLAMGTGTYAFLVGVGFFQEGGFTVEQYFMRDFDEEEILLTLLADVVDSFSQIVTFNGRTFDLQLLRNRYLMTGILPPFDRIADLDLLFLSRRFFRHRLVNCRLTTIEKDILGFHREGDIDGSLIPDLYFRYLRKGNFPELDLILQHNVWDILSMAYLTHLFYSSLQDPFETSELHGGVFLHIGNYLDEAGSSVDRTVERCYREAMKSGLDNAEGYEAAKRMSLCLRRQMDYKSASEIWQMMVDSAGSDDTFPYVELAKHCEHRLKDFDKAIELVHEALMILETRDNSYSPFQMERERKELVHRLSRLERRSEKRRSDNPGCAGDIC
jgi:uncharacterized protein YprB with RNaseH-like and TPR domain